VEQAGICAYVAQQALAFLKRGVRINRDLAGPTDTPLAQPIRTSGWVRCRLPQRGWVEVSTSVEQAWPLVFLCSDARRSHQRHHDDSTDIGYVSSAIAESFPSAKMMVNFLRGVGGGGGGSRKSSAVRQSRHRSSPNLGC